MSIQGKVALGVLCCFGLVGVVHAILASHQYAEESARAAQHAVHTAVETYGALERAEVGKLSAALEALAANPALAAAFERRDRDQLLAAAAPVFEKLRERHGVTHWYFIEPEPVPTVFLRVHRPSLHGDLVARTTLSEAIRTHATTSGTDLGKTAFALRAVRPWHLRGRLAGYLELGEEIEQFLLRMKAQTGDDYGVVVDPRHLDPQDWMAVRGAPPAALLLGRPVLVESTGDDRLLGFAGSIDELPEAGAILGPVEANGSTRVRGIVPLRDAAGRRMGALAVLHDVTENRRLMERQRLSILVAALVSATAAAVLLYLLLHRLVFRRISRMTARMLDATTRLAGGESDLGAETTGAPRDEIGNFEAFFGHFLQGVGAALGSSRPPKGRPEDGGPARA